MNEKQPSIDSLYPNVGSWHGTGRYRYKGEEIADTLQDILTHGGLLPHEDEWDQKRGSTHSISMARARAYGRLYASLYFPKEEMSIAEYHRRVWASAYFFLSSKGVAWLEYLPPRPHFLDFRRKAKKWASKFSKQPQPFLGLFTFGGTDIPDNYPILIGIKHGAYTATRGSRFIDLHEDRSPTAISIKDFTHIEVPQRRIAETRQVLEAAGCELPVVALEVGDRYGRQLVPTNSGSNSGDE